LQAALPRHPNAFSRMVTRSRGRPRPAGRRNARERASKVTRLLGEALTWLTLMHASAMIATRLHAHHRASAAWVVLWAAPPAGARGQGEAPGGHQFRSTMDMQNQ